MDEPKADDAPTPPTEESAFAKALTAATQPGAPATPASTIARGSGHISTRTEQSVMEGLPEAKKERIAAMRRELADVQQQLIDAQQRVATELKGRADDAERFEALEARLQAQELEAKRDAARAAELETVLATRTSERDAEQSTRSRLEGELEVHRKQQREAADQVEVQLAAVRDAKALVATRDAELSTISSKRDSLEVELEQMRRDLDAARAKSRDIANRIVGFGQDLLGGDGAAPAVEVRPAEVKPAEPPAAPRRTQPPPLPQRPAAPPVHVETILEVTEQPKRATSFVASALFVLGGLALGCAGTLAFMNTGTSTAASNHEDLGAPPPSAPAAPLAMEPAPEAAPPPPASPAPATPPPVAPADIKADGVIVLPAAASGHRVFVDGRLVEVKSSRATVPCGSHQIRIGSTGTVRALDIACGGETSIPPDPTDR